ncbi:MAG TPA: hypothetical protein PKI61_02735 [bacterium]|mgnify:CR=1 FL=1|nr:hypothetical protein [bacterium]HPT29575.1 hypothetical protein [bacterium]
MNYETASELFQFLKTEKEILKLLAQVESQDIEDASRGVIPLLKLEKKSERRILDIVKQANYNQIICAAALPYIKSEYQIFNIIKKTHGQSAVCLAAIPCLKLRQKTDKQLLTALKRMGSHLLACQMIIPYLNLKKKNQEQIWEIIQKSGYATGICLEAINHLKLTENQALMLLRMNDDFDLSRKVIPYLELKNKTESEIMALLEKIGYPAIVCCAGIQFLKQEELILRLMTLTNFHVAVCQLGVNLLKPAEQTEKRLMEITRKTAYHPHLCWYFIAFIKSKKRILEIMKGTNYDARICKEVLQREKLS